MGRIGAGNCGDRGRDEDGIMRRTVRAALAILALAAPAAGRDFPKETADQAAAIDALVRGCVGAGGLARGRDGRPTLVVDDPAKLRAAVASARARLTPDLRVGLILRSQR